MQKLLFLSLFLLLLACSKEDCKDLGLTDFEFVTLAELPSEIKEASGVEMTGDSFWSFNDNSGDKKLYQFDRNGVLLKSLKISDSRDDWEDLAQDSEGNFYLGDFGNNDNDRTNLKIYKIAADKLISETSVQPEIISFSLEDQTDFPPKKDNRHFGIEGFFHFGNDLFLFSKDRSDPFEGITKLYRLSAQPGNQKATLISEFTTDNCGSGKGAITGADISPDQTKIAICSNEAVWLFTDFQGSNFFSGNVVRYDLPIQRQMEGIVFDDDCTLFLVNEKGGDKGRLFRMKVCE